MTAAAPIAAAPPPLRTAAVRTIGCVLAVVTGVIGVAGVHEALVVWGAVGGRGAVSAALDALEKVDLTGPGARTATVVGIAAVIVGLVLLVVAMSRRRRRTLSLRDVPFLVVEPRDVARLTSAAVREVDGVLGVSSTASRTRVLVQVESTGAAAVTDRARQVAAESLALLSPPPTVRVRASTPRDGTPPPTEGDRPETAARLTDAEPAASTGTAPAAATDAEPAASTVAAPAAATGSAAVASTGAAPAVPPDGEEES